MTEMVIRVARTAVMKTRMVMLVQVQPRFMSLEIDRSKGTLLSKRGRKSLRIVAKDIAPMRI
jgi:hypothetical protein